MIQLLPDTVRRKPYPLSWPEHRLHEMALFKVNTGCREQEVCQLEWAWEVPVPGADCRVFVIPDWLAKNGVFRVIALNSIARRVIESQRGRHPKFVFTYEGEPAGRIHNSARKRARRDAAEKYADELGSPAPEGFKNRRVHDLEHTFGRRLRRAV